MWYGGRCESLPAACWRSVSIRRLTVPVAALAQAARTLAEVRGHRADARTAVDAAASARADASEPARATRRPAAPAPPARRRRLSVVADRRRSIRLGFDRDKVPAMVQSLTADDFARTHSPNVTDTLLQRVPGVTPDRRPGQRRSRISAIAALRPRRCRARRKGSPSTWAASASTRRSATPSTGT